MASGDDRKGALNLQLLCRDRFNALWASARENLSQLGTVRPPVQPPSRRLLMTPVISSASGFGVQQPVLNQHCVLHQSVDDCQQLTHDPGMAISLSTGPCGHLLPSKLSLHKYETHGGLFSRALTPWHSFRINRQVSGPYNPAPK